MNLFRHGEHGDTESTEKITLETAFNAEIAEAQRTQRKPEKTRKSFLSFSAISVFEAVSRLFWFNPRKPLSTRRHGDHGENHLFSLRDLRVSVFSVLKEFAFRSLK
jgi:hypothetical protein